MNDREKQAEDGALNLIVVLFYLPVALGSLLYLGWSGGEFALVRRTVGEDPVRDAVIGVAVGLVLVVATRLAVLLPSGKQMADVFARVLGRPGLLACVGLASAAAIAEELLFRAVLQPELGIWVVTFLFAAAHFPFDRGLVLWPLLAFPTGLTFGLLYEWTGAALAPIFAHAVVNAVNLRWIARRGR